jgi:glucose-1-phosphate thymidylyltransferase
MAVKGVILAGGTGTRLWPATEVVLKQLMPVYDKPMIYYPLTTLMSSGVREFLIITPRADLLLYKQLLGDGTDLGIRVQYAVQEAPKGIAQAIIIADDERFLQDAEVIALILGDNLFAGEQATTLIGAAIKARTTLPQPDATIFITEVRDPQRYGVAVIRDGDIVDILEKPTQPPTNLAVTGLYLYGPECVAAARKLRPSARGELEITDLNKQYLYSKALNFRTLGRGTAWLDTGTPDALLQASQYVQTIQARHGVFLGCPEEAAYTNGWISAAKLERRSDRYPNPYGVYLRQCLQR